MVLILKLIRIVLIPVFLTINRLKGLSLPAFRLSEGIAPHPRFTEGELGRGVEKNRINLLLTFMNNVDLRLKFFDSELFSKICTLCKATIDDRLTKE
jgi:hypothetical protein